MFNSVQVKQIRRQSKMSNLVQVRQISDKRDYQGGDSTIAFGWREPSWCEGFTFKQLR